MAANSVLVTGWNHCAELGLNHKNDVKKLKIIYNNDQYNITNIYSSREHTVYCNYNENKYYSTGQNSRGQCGIGKHWTNNQKGRIEYCVLKLTQIKYFKINKISIKKVCTDIYGHNIFWITKNNKLYVNGSNDMAQLGINKKRKHKKWGDGFEAVRTKYEPFLVSSLENVTDSCIAENYSLVLCDYNNINNIICNKWFKMNVLIKTIPNDIKQLIIMFYRSSTSVYSTGHQYMSGNGHVYGDYDESFDHKFKEIKTFKNIQIISIKVGCSHSLFLDKNGIIWGSGRNRNGEIAVAEDAINSGKPIPIKYFIDKNIKIKQIECGGWHNFAVDTNNNIYSWGCDDRGQCGHGVIGINSVDTVWEPKLINFFKNDNVKIMKCGSNHSYVQTQKNKHYLFGGNLYNECLTFNNEENAVIPNCINKRFENSKQKIKCVSLGVCNTKIVIYGKIFNIKTLNKPIKKKKEKKIIIK